jgi:hypothetical protein
MRTSLHVLQRAIPSRRMSIVCIPRTTEHMLRSRVYFQTTGTGGGLLAALVGCVASCVAPLDDPFGFSASRDPALCVLTWNLNAGVQPGSGATFDATNALLESLPACDLMVFTEVQPERALAFQDTLRNEQPSLSFHIGSTGNNQRIMIAWDTRRFQAGTPTEVAIDGSDGRGRAPLILPLLDLIADVPLLLTAVHLRAADDAERDLELDGLRQLLAGRRENQLVLGDLNAGCETSRGSEGFQGCATAFYNFVQAVNLYPLESEDRRSTLCRLPEEGPTPDLCLLTPDWIESSRWLSQLDAVDWCSTMSEGAHRPQGWTITYR